MHTPRAQNTCPANSSEYDCTPTVPGTHAQLTAVSMTTYPCLGTHIQLTAVRTAAHPACLGMHTQLTVVSSHGGAVILRNTIWKTSARCMLGALLSALFAG